MSTVIQARADGGLDQDDSRVGGMTLLTVGSADKLDQT